MAVERDEKGRLLPGSKLNPAGKQGRQSQSEWKQWLLELDPDDPFSFTALSVTYQKAFAGTRNQEYIRLAEEAMYRANAMQARR